MPHRPREAAALQSAWKEESTRGSRVAIIASVTPLAVFVSAGAFKGSTLLDWVPFDLTAAGAVATAAVCAHLLLSDRQPCWKALFAVLVLAAAFLPAAIWSPPSEYATDKVLRLFTLSFLALAAGAIILKDRARATAFLWVLVVLGWVTVGLATIAPDREAFGRLVADGGSTINLGRMAGATVIILLAGMLYGRSAWLWPALLSSLPLYALVASGSRGPLLATAIAVAVLFVLANSGGARRLGRIALLAVVLIATILIGVLPRVDETALSRIGLLFSADQGASVDARQGMISETAEVLLQYPLGVGWGGLGEVLDPYVYPHNLLLEVGAEGGWIALLALVSVVVAALSTGLAGRTDVARATIAALVVFHLINSLVSGDVNSNRPLFALIGAALALGWCSPNPREPASAEQRPREAPTPSSGQLTTRSR